MPPRGHYLLRAHQELLDARVEISQGGRSLGHARLVRVMPGRSATLVRGWATSVDPDGGPVTLRVTRARQR
jgi:hypothetical protein